jgi:carbon storage regulator CsrA
VAALSITRRANEAVWIGDILVIVTEIHVSRSRVTLRIVAPPEVKIRRSELDPQRTPGAEPPA